MRSSHRGNALLVELLIVMAFFMLSATVLIQVFAAARNQSARAELITQTLAEAQNIADRLYAADDAEALLQSLGFVREDAAWVLDNGDYTVAAQLSVEPGPAGIYRRTELTVCAAEEQLFTLPCSRFLEVTHE